MWAQKQATASASPEIGKRCESKIGACVVIAVTVEAVVFEDGGNFIFETDGQGIASPAKFLLKGLPGAITFIISDLEFGGAFGQACHDLTCFVDLLLSDQPSDGSGFLCHCAEVLPNVFRQSRPERR